MSSRIWSDRLLDVSLKRESSDSLVHGIFINEQEQRGIKEDCYVGAVSAEGRTNLAAA